MELTQSTHIKLSPIDMEARKKTDIRSGDTVRVHQNIEEKGKMRTQIFEGLVLAVKHGTQIGATFSVRKVASGVGVEKTFPLYSPMIEKIEIVKRSKVRRSKLYYIRDKVAREIRRKMKRMFVMRNTGEVVESEESTASAPETAEAEPAKE